MMARKVFPAVIGEVQFVQGECKYINNTNWGKYFYGQKINLEHIKRLAVPNKILQFAILIRGLPDV
jgi:hypothetical protein